MISVLLALAIGMAVFLAVHLSLWRIRPSTEPRVGLVFLLMAGGCLVSALTYPLIRAADAPAVFVVISLSAALYALYLSFYLALARSVSVTLLARLFSAPDPIRIDALVAEYQASPRFDDRLTVMADMGLIERRNGDRFRITEKGRRTVKTIGVFVAIFSGGGLEG